MASLVKVAFLIQLFRNKIISAYLTSILGVFSGLLTNFWLLKELTIQIDPADFGLYCYIYQITSYLLILQLGMDFSVSRQIAEFLGKGQTHQAGIAYQELKRFNRYGIVLVVVAVLAATFFFHQGYGVDPVRKALAVKLVLLTGFNQVLVFLQRPFSAALIGAHKQEAVNVITVVRTVVTTIFAYALLTGGMGVLSTPLAEIVTQVVANIVLMFYSGRQLQWMNTNASPRNPDIFKNILHFAFFSTLGGLAWTVEATSDVLLIRHIVKDLSLLSVYVVWWRFPQMLFDLSTRLGSSAFPVFAAQHGANDGSMEQTLNQVLLGVVFLASLTLIGISLWLPSFMWLWFPSAYQMANPYMLSFLMGVLVAVRIVGNLFGYFLLALSNTKLTTRLAWIQALLKVGLAYWTLNQWSVSGLLVSSCIAALLQPVVYGMFLIRKKFLRIQHIRFVVFALLSSCLAAYLLPSAALDSSLTQLVAGVLLTTLFWVICFIMLTWVNKPYRELLQVLWEKFKGRVYAG